MMTRWILVFSLWATGLLCAAERPNIIFLFADDQTFDSLGCYGNEEVKTPHIDGLAKQGLVFDHYYNTTAICMASRANVMTGLYEYRTGCNFGKGNLPKKLFNQSYPVLLRKAGYVTAIAGKIGFEVEGVGLPEDSFDWWGAGPGQTHYETKRNKSMVKYAGDYPHSTLSYGAFGSDFINWAKEKDKPFCLSISFKAPHRPVQPDPKFDAVYAETVFAKRANYGRDKGLHFAEQSRRGRQYPRFVSWGYQDDYQKSLRLYHQQIYAIDQAVGMLRKTLDKAGSADNTVIIYTSDNGFMNGAHGYGSKVIPYEESARAPFIFHDPRSPSSHGKRTAALSGNIDVAPTILELAGLDAPKKLDGKSLVPLLTDPKKVVHKDLAIMNCWGPQPCQSFGVLTERHKYIYWYFDDETMDPDEELYDLSVDRLEMKNLAADGAEAGAALTEMRKIYDRYIEHIGKTAERPNYKEYATLFHRGKPWAAKQKLLPKKLTPTGR